MPSTYIVEFTISSRGSTESVVWTWPVSRKGPVETRLSDSPCSGGGRVVEMTANGVRGPGAGHRGSNLAADRHRKGAARMEVTAARRVQRRWHLSRQDHLLDHLIGVGRQRSRHQRLGVRVERLLEQLVAFGVLDDLTQVHDGYR